MFHEEVSLFLAAASVQSEVQVKLHRVHSGKSVGQSSRLIEDPTRVRVIHFRWHHQEGVRPLPTSSSCRSSRKRSGDTLI